MALGAVTKVSSMAWCASRVTHGRWNGCSHDDKWDDIEHSREIQWRDDDDVARQLAQRSSERGDLHMFLLQHRVKKARHLSRKGWRI